MAANVETINVTAAGLGSAHNTLDGTNADSITVNCSAFAAATGTTRPAAPIEVTVLNKGGGEIQIRWDGTTAVFDANGTYAVPAGRDYTFEVTGSPVVSLIAGSAIAYSLQTMPVRN